MAISVDSFAHVLTEAIDDIVKHGFDSQQRVDEWVRRLAQAARHSLMPLHVVDDNLRRLLLSVFKRATRADKLMRLHRGVSRYTIEQVAPKLRGELDRRIMASANLIKLNREEEIAKTLRRFQGWATSIPSGGSDVANRVKIRREVRKGLSGLPFEQRRVIIDQGSKLAAAVSNIVATDGGAIAGRWHSHWREIGYQFRPDHKARDGEVYLIRDSWAAKDGLVKGRYSDQIEQPAELPFCRCYYEYLYSPSQLPSDMLTDKGRAKLKDIRRQMREFEQVGVSRAA
jgi:hypothetical protein